MRSRYNLLHVNDTSIVRNRSSRVRYSSVCRAMDDFLRWAKICAGICVPRFETCAGLWFFCLAVRCQPSMERLGSHTGTRRNVMITYLLQRTQGPDIGLVVQICPLRMRCEIQWPKQYLSVSRLRKQRNGRRIMVRFEREHDGKTKYTKSRRS